VKILVILILLLLPAAVFSDSLVFKLPALKISQVEGGKNVVYEFDESQNLFVLTDSVLTANPMLYKYSVNLRDVSRIAFYKEHNVAPAFVLGFGLGGLIGYWASGWGMHSNPTVTRRVLGLFFGGTILGLISAGIAFLSSPNDVYDLSTNNLTEKKKIVLEVFKKNKIK
jgi:hypothetical protein